MTLLMRDQENIEKGREEGRKEGREEGREEGIFAMIAALKELNIADSIILGKVCEKFKLTEDTAKTYL